VHIFNVMVKRILINYSIHPPQRTLADKLKFGIVIIRILQQKLLQPSGDREGSNSYIQREVSAY